MIVQSLVILLSLAYAGLMFTYRSAWKALPGFNYAAGFIPTCSISVLIPARNEAGHMERCLKSILKVEYPRNLLQIIVIDDFSTDETVAIALQLPARFKLTGSSVSCIRLADLLPPEARFTANKKKAIELGIAQAKGEIIVTTDADCVVPKNWLLHIAYAFENPETNMVSGPVAFHQEKNLLQRFQSLDFLGMMGITGAGAQLGWFNMANGANLAYRKTAFENAGGYEGNEHRASGDDMFLAQKVAARWPGSVCFLKSLEATVLTESAADVQAFWQQRLRWGTKNAALSSWPLRLSLLSVFLFCWSIWLNLIWVIYLRFADGAADHFWILGIQIGIKAAFDYYFLSEMCRFFKRKDLLRWFWPSFFLHTLYIALIGTASIIVKNYTWKGRPAR